MTTELLQMLLRNNRLLHRGVIPLLTPLLFFLFAGSTLFCVKCCVAVFQYTVPALPVSLQNGYSATTYWQNTNLWNHFHSMPSSAQKYFVLHFVGSIANTVLAGITAVRGSKQLLGKYLRVQTVKKACHCEETQRVDVAIRPENL